MKKIFIVGCPRSGTTLLQSLIASHSQVVSFPETHLFSKTMHINPLIRAFTIYTEKKLVKVNQIVRQFGAGERITASFPVFSSKKWAGILIEALDEIGIANRLENESILLEKTPRHLHYIGLIQKAEPDAIFIHLIRKGEDVVASLMEATEENPEQWKGRRPVDKSVFWWNRSIRISNKYIGKPGHLHIRYENIIHRPEQVLRFICDKASLEFEEEMLKHFQDTARELIESTETWKSRNTVNEIKASGKFDLLPDEVKQQIKSSLIHFDYSRIDLPET